MVESRERELEGGEGGRRLALECLRTRRRSKSEELVRWMNKGEGDTAQNETVRFRSCHDLRRAICFTKPSIPTN